MEVKDCLLILTILTILTVLTILTILTVTIMLTKQEENDQMEAKESQLCLPFLSPTSAHPPRSEEKGKKDL